MNEKNPTISKGVDWSLAWIYLILVVVGITAIFAVTYKEGDPVFQSFLGFKTDYSKQFYFFIASAIMGVFILITDSKFFTATANIWYAFGIFLLLLVFPFHSSVKGTESIIRFGGFQFQPAEFCKICVCLALAKYLSRSDTEFVTTRSQLIAAAIVLFPAVINSNAKRDRVSTCIFFFFYCYVQGRTALYNSCDWLFISCIGGGNFAGRKKYIGSHTHRHRFNGHLFLMETDQAQTDIFYLMWSCFG